MADTTKRKRGAVSYKEPSSDEDFSESAIYEQTPQRKRTAPSRRSARHKANDDDSSRQTTPDPSPAPEPSRKKYKESRTRRHHKVSYKDISSDEDEDPDVDFEVPDEHVKTSQRRATATATATATAAPPPRPQRSRKGKDRGRPKQKLAIGRIRKPNRSPDAAAETPSVPSDGQKPAWQTLPYHILLQVFVYASHPLHDENLRPTASIPWLVQVARICSTFTKPALTALYRNPPIFAMRQTRRNLVHHLIQPPDEAHETYRVMPKRLTFDATQMSTLTDPTHSVADLAALVRSLTTLREIDFFDPIDRPPFRERLRRVRRWVYPDELFTALRETELRLRSWRWNSTFCQYGPLWMKGIHGDQAFQSLRELTLVKYHPEPSREEEEDDDDDEEANTEPTMEELVGSALAVLPNLKSLTFETCGIVRGRLLPLLPTNLVSLSIVNCGELLSDVLSSFLTTHGAHLEELVLHHNQALDLSFLVDLKQSCPKLEVLRMDTTYYSSLVMSSDNEPLYEALLGENEVPTWPTTLRTLDMQYLRKWDSTAASHFFQSLVDSAEELLNLQDLTIIAMVDTDWRQRAKFRSKWTATFQTVFARKWEPPNPHLASLKAYRLWKEGQNSLRTQESQIEEEEKVDSFIEGVSEELTKTQATEESDSDAPLLSRRKKQDQQWGSTRLRSRAKVNASYDEESEDSDSEHEAEEEKVSFVQGRCHTVIFRIDNFRPREEIYAEADFLDAEPSGDDEWNGNDEANDEGGGYAW
ncbi:uncharacterized protein EKO05_0008537 [Ascochyta rabiei]|uniref:Uncharacterized protein n=1 Tax=Didymella rabiei TaxID=5454 RepID=A0A163MMF9_DIDRA|nr:uncharacterized protein EKO05_0008537 [Ascochyta rabiei]KZM28842.1 hypothetical protein ST47_g15 [Ascochyta rabiei]UPX18230.1 hypothetical protein EKO05_0008537 [Ascochyta rabiei]